MALTGGHVAGVSLGHTADHNLIDGILGGLNSTYLVALKPEKFGAIGDGIADDTAALTAMYAAAGDIAVFKRGATYKTNAVTFSKDTDLNGATLNINGRLTFAGKSLRNGAISTNIDVHVSTLTDIIFDRLTITNSVATSNGIVINGCARVGVTNCVVNGGNRGIVLQNCDDFSINGNIVTGVAAPDGCGIRVESETGQLHGNGEINNNRVTGCQFGIVIWGGIADPADVRFAADYTLANIEISNNIVSVSFPYVLVGGIYATRSKGLLMQNNIITGGIDVGLDVEYCTQCTMIGNHISEVTNGALAVIFGSTDILITNNRVTYTGAGTGSATTIGATWARTGAIMVLLRDTPQRITIRGNVFTITNGTLGKIYLGQASGGLTVAGNTFKNCYVIGDNAVAGNVTDTYVIDNRFDFDVNINNSVIYHEKVLRFHAERNIISLKSGEVIEEYTRKYITVRDSGTGTSNFVWIIDNIIDAHIAEGILVSSSSVTMFAWIVGNFTDNISIDWNAGAASSNLTFHRNYKMASPGSLATLTALDNAALHPTFPAI